MGKVNGKVTLDGMPLPSVMVTFSPADGRRESFAITSSSGDYELRYSSQMRGAEIGQHEVRVSPEGVEPKAPLNSNTPKGIVPAEYFGDKYLIFTVNKGVNVIDLLLNSKDGASK